MWIKHPEAIYFSLIQPENPAKLVAIYLSTLSIHNVQPSMAINHTKNFASY